MMESGFERRVSVGDELPVPVEEEVRIESSVLRPSED
jgi:hypothetical protein